MAMFPYDVGVADINDDGWLDIQTTNHQARPLVLINRQGGEFVNSATALNLGTDRTQRAAEGTGYAATPAIDRPGVYIFWDRTDLVVRAHPIPGQQPVEGFLLLWKKRSFSASGQAEMTTMPVAELVAGTTPPLLGTWSFGASFRFAGEGVLRIKCNPHWDAWPTAPVTVHLAEPFPLASVFVGDAGGRAAARTVVLRPDDRHAMAWLDWNGDGRTDVITVSGGEQGLLQGRRDPGQGSYRLLVQDADGKFSEVEAGEDLDRFGCSSRDISLADVNRDGTLDLYQVCGRGPKLANQLFEQGDDGTFREVAAARGLDLEGEGRTAWLDVDRDGDPDLVWATRKGVWLYRNDAGHFTGALVAPMVATAAQLTVDDFDRDGDLDLYLAAPGASLLLVNDDGRLVPVDPRSRGLPADAVCASWVDYDNDGLDDLHVLPGGLFRQSPTGQFTAAGLLGSAEALEEAHCNWADFDNDGDLDLVLARPTPRGRLQKLADWLDNRKAIEKLQDEIGWWPLNEPRLWTLDLYTNEATGNDWLDLQLVGRHGNNPALGAVVRVRTDAEMQTHQVGQLDGGRKSVGHYRVHFGLGPGAVIHSLDIAWPDGTLQTLFAEPKNQLLVVRQGDPQSAHPPLY